MLITRIIGDCPRCRKKNSFGNVNVYSNTLVRGCGSCSFKQEFLLPQLHKTILYLDQSFLSHAFRQQLPEFATASQLISNLAHDQLLVSPFSSLHETETFQWRDSRRDQLWDFIRQVARHHEFTPYYEIKHQQLLDSFERFLANGTISPTIDASDALPFDLNDWDDYFAIEVDGFTEPPEKIREGKSKSTARLPGLFVKWRESSDTFEQHLLSEYRAAGQAYMQIYSNMILRLAMGDIEAIIDSPIDSQIVERMIRVLEGKGASSDQLPTLTAFFESEYYRLTPFEHISCGIVTVLRDHVRNRHYSNPDKLAANFSGFFFDLNHVSAYAPYCNAMFVDSEMHRLVSDNRLLIHEKYGTHFFSKSNISEFINYLLALNRTKSDELARALTLVYPPSARAANA